MSTAAQPKAKKTAAAKKPLSHPTFAVVLSDDFFQFDSFYSCSILVCLLICLVAFVRRR